jgi:hypothetical protein
MIPDIISVLDRKFERRINDLYTFAASVIGIVALISGGQPPLPILSAVTTKYLGAPIPWFETAQAWITDRTWLAPWVCTLFVAAATLAILRQGLHALGSRSAATLWLLVGLSVSRQTNILVLILVIFAILSVGGHFRHRLDCTGFVPAEAVLLGLTEGPLRIMRWLMGYTPHDESPQDVPLVDELGFQPPTGAEVVRLAPPR